ncbi:MAG TPA: UDP-N-acetylmuramate dehydrogenase [Candidatus Pelagibacter sp.]|jgi:UDP-N-acetylmuramate dehydrogenase|nr:UDP-N-acetylmuramate dehydrogenase [Candidatus Pelagibacter sp.]
MKNIKKIKSKILGRISFNESLSKFSWFNLGGPAKVLFRPKDLRDLSTFLKEINESNKIKVLGVGSNTLIRDGGFDGIIIKFGKSFSRLSMFNPNTIIAGASALDKSVSNFALENSLSGFEFFSCIPGSIGGAIKMNSGCYNEDISQVLISLQVMDLKGNIRVIQSSNIKFNYRGSDLDNNLIFISATLRGKKDKKTSIQEKMLRLIEKKKMTQPSKIKTCGSTFKNSEKRKAWELINDSGCVGMKVGDAEISTKHCNFFVNNGKAKSNDLEKLINKVKNKVKNKTGINLELELQIIGER